MDVQGAMAASAVVEIWPTQAVSIRDIRGSRSIPPREGRAMERISEMIWFVSRFEDVQVFVAVMCM
jgi:hypothetical protein